jgi:hypothetical protein
MTGIQRLTPANGAGMRRDDEGPYVRYLDHVEALARAEASAVHQRAAMSTIPLDVPAEQLKAENARLRTAVAHLPASLGVRPGAADRPDAAPPRGQARKRS